MSVKTTIQWIKHNPFIDICTALSVVLFALLAYRLSEMNELGSRMDEVQDRIAKIHRNSRYSATMDDDLKRLDDYQLRIAKSLMSPSAKASNLAYFYGVGSRVGVSVLRVEQKQTQGLAARTPDAISELKYYSTVQFDIGVEGAFADILRFLDAVRTDHPLMRIEKMNISSSKNATGHNDTVNVVLTVLTDLQTEAR